MRVRGVDVRRASAVAAIAIVGAVSSVVAPSADATFPGRNGEVMYSWQDVSGKALWSYSGVSALATRTKVSRHLATCFWDNTHENPSRRNCSLHDPAVSRDGMRVAVVVADSSVGESSTLAYRLLLVTMNGAPEQSLPLDGPAFDPAWSPSGDQIVVTRYLAARGWQTEGSPRLALLDGQGREIGTIGGEGASDADWAASGETAYVQDGSVWAMRPGGSPRRLTTGRSPSWSPDSRMIAFERDGRIWTVWADGTRERRLADVPAVDPVWSPDGRYVGFGQPQGWMDHLGLGSISVMRADGRCPHVLQRALGWTGYGSPTWRSLPGSAPKRLGPPACDRRAKKQRAAKRRAAKRRAAKRCNQKQRAVKPRTGSRRCGVGSHGRSRR